MRNYPLCDCEHEHYDHTWGEGDDGECHHCTCRRYILVKSNIPKNACPRCYNIIPKKKRHEKVGIFNWHQEKCIEIG